MNRHLEILYDIYTVHGKVQNKELTVNCTQSFTEYSSSLTSYKLVGISEWMRFFGKRNLDCQNILVPSWPSNIWKLGTCSLFLMSHGGIHIFGNVFTLQGSDQCVQQLAPIDRYRSSLSHNSFSINCPCSYICPSTECTCFCRG